MSLPGTSRSGNLYFKLSLCIKMAVKKDLKERDGNDLLEGKFFFCDNSKTPTRLWGF